MLPAFEPGDRLLLVRTRRLRAGQVVALPDPRDSDRILVKRIASVDGDGLDVRGDNDMESTDSRHFGPVRAASVVGRPLYRYAPEARSGWWPR